MLFYTWFCSNAVPCKTYAWHLAKTSLGSFKIRSLLSLSPPFVSLTWSQVTCHVKCPMSWICLLALIPMLYISWKLEVFRKAWRNWSWQHSERPVVSLLSALCSDGTEESQPGGSIINPSSTSSPFMIFTEPANRAYSAFLILLFFPQLLAGAL